jgi:hypothetical protein
VTSRRTFHHFPSFFRDTVKWKFEIQMLNFVAVFTSLIKQLFKTALSPRETIVKAHFGLSIHMISRVFLHISFHDYQNLDNISPLDLLIGLHFLKIYATENVSCVFFHIAGKTWKKRRDSSIVAIYLRLPDVLLNLLMQIDPVGL